MKLKSKQVYIETLGCNKNTVDSEIIATLLKRNGIPIVKNPDDADVIVVNTCAFIDEAKEESINTILSLAEYKKNGKKLIVSGCLAQIYSSELLKEIPEIDTVAGVENLDEIVNQILKDRYVRDLKVTRNISSRFVEYPERECLLSGNGTAYIKIAEGCNVNCSFCIIPKIRGPLRSRRIENIVEEANRLIELGVKELILVSQDTLSYGVDIGLENGLDKLLKALLSETDAMFIRVLYLRPAHELLNVQSLFGNSRVLPYFDIPIQHVSKKILKLMNRRGGYDEYLQLLSKIREMEKRAVIRTSVIVGFPGEDDNDFNELVSFLKEARINHLGVFTFSPQRESEAWNYKPRVKKVIAEKRKKKIYDLQEEISYSLLRKEKGKTFDVLIEEKVRGKDIYFGRSYHFAPEVDGTFVVYSEKRLTPGAVVKARVERADVYDLHGVIV